MALKELYQAFTGQTDFLFQVAGACLVASRDILNEAPATANHTNRIIWANVAKKNPKDMARRMLVSVLDNASVAATVPAATDNDVQFVVNSLIDTFATGG